MGKQLNAHIPHGPLADHLGDPALPVPEEKLRYEQSHEEEGDAPEPVPVAWHHVIIDGNFGQVRGRLTYSGGQEDDDEGDGDPASVRAQVRQQPRHETRVDATGGDLFFDHRSSNS